MKNPKAGQSITVRAEGLTKIFHTRGGDEIRAVDDLSFSCRSGEIMGILGPNGAGKTTALRMLTTILSPTAGKATVNGYRVGQSPQRVRDSVGFLATETGLYERLTAEETLNFFGRINGLSEKELGKRKKEVFQTLDMTDFARRKVGDLSTGMKQKLSLARSIIHDPPILIFDEPTRGLDVMTAKTVTDYVKRFKEEDKTIILSTHLMNVVERLCDRVGILFEGKLKALGRIEELLEERSVADLEELFFSLAEDSKVKKNQR